MIKFIREFIVNFNINDLNLILTLAGFPIVTTLLPFIPSVPYRAFALAVALACLFKNGLHFTHGLRQMKWLLFFLIIVDLKVLIQCTFVTPEYQESAANALLFTFGVTLLPSLAIFSGIEKIHWHYTLWLLWALLTLVLIVGDMTIRISMIDVMNSQRMSLNDRQSTLALGDNGGLLCILASVLFFDLKYIDKKFFRYILMSLLILSICAGIFGIAKAASRGPVLSLIAGLMFILLGLNTGNRVKIFVLSIAMIIIFGINTSKIENFAPVLFYRFTNTIEDGDLSGRDVTFADAWQTIESHPLLGGDPLILSYNSGSFVGFHNGFLAVGLAAGMWGFILYVIFILSLVLMCFKNRNNLSTKVDFFIYGFFGFYLMRSMSGASMISNPVYVAAIGLACYYLVSDKTILLNTNEHNEQFGD